jgi:MFS transporter, BCD family, chlorophyll transporter
MSPVQQPAMDVATPPARRSALPARRAASAAWLHVSRRMLPFADAASDDLPLGRLLRLSLFQVAAGMATALLVGTLNRVMIVELGIAAWWVALMVALPLVVAPLRALIGFRSDHHQSVLGWRRVPYIWFGSMLQFGGLSIMPFALLVMSGQGVGPAWIGQVGAGLAFLLVGAGVQVVQTTGLALATDLAPEASRPRVVALMYVMLLLGMVVSGFAFSALLADFSDIRLIKVVQGAAMVSMALNLVAMWKQEARDPSRTNVSAPKPNFRQAWRDLMAQPNARRFLVTVGLGTAAFNMQDVVLEPYGGEILRLGVGDTSMLTALMAVGALAAFALAARWLTHGVQGMQVSAWGLVAGLPAFAAVVLAAPLDAPWLFRVGTVVIGFGSGLFAVGTLMTAMSMERREHVGLALGAWGAVQATAAGAAIAGGGALRDLVNVGAAQGWFGPAFAGPSSGYMLVYHLELGLLFVALVALGPLVRRTFPPAAGLPASPFGLADFPR